MLVELVGGQVPTRGSDEAAGLDLYANEVANIPAHSRQLIGTGIKTKLPFGTYRRIAPRSGLAVKGIDVAAGVVDRDYRGELKVVLVNTTAYPFPIRTGERIAQLILEHIATADIEIVETLDATKRNEKGFGSSGK